MSRAWVIACLLMAAFARESFSQPVHSGPVVASGSVPGAGQAAGAAAFPSQPAIEREMERLESDRQNVFSGLDGRAGQALPHVFPNIATPAPSGIDIEQLARQYEQKAMDRRSEELMIFASFTMPEASLKRLVNQANRVGASVVLRGFKNNSIRETTRAIHALKEQGGNVLVNPNAFTKYKIEAVPTFVLTRATAADAVDEQGCALPDTYVSVAGDVSLDHALDVVSRQSKDFSSLAERYLNQFRERRP